MIDTARVVSAEGAALVERQTTALFGDIKELTQQMQVRLIEHCGVVDGAYRVVLLSAVAGINVCVCRVQQQKSRI
jgi:hypothetical protein